MRYSNSQSPLEDINTAVGLNTLLVLVTDTMDI